MELNKEYLAFLHHMGWDTHFSSLMLHTPLRKVGESSVDQYKGFSQQIMNFILKQNHSLRAEVKEDMNQMRAAIDAQRKL